jgi:hypothetical protein
VNLQSPKDNPLQFIFFAGNQKLPGYEHPSLIHEDGKINFPPLYNYPLNSSTPFKWHQRDALFPFKHEENVPTHLWTETASVEGWIKRELGHHWRKITTPQLNVHCTVDNVLAPAYGFQRSKGNPEQFLIQGKRGEFYAGGGGGWSLSNDSGQILDGNVLNINQLRQVAKVPPGSIEWPHPIEAEPESLARVWLGGSAATILQSRSPGALNAARKRDEELIALVHGKDSAGNPLKVRDLNGRLVARNAINIQFIQEQQARALASLAWKK